MKLCNNIVQSGLLCEFLDDSDTLQDYVQYNPAMGTSPRIGYHSLPCEIKCNWVTIVSE